MQFVAILAESLADAKDMKPRMQTLEKFSVSYELILALVHRGVERIEQFVKKAQTDSVQIEVLLT